MSGNYLNIQFEGVFKLLKFKPDINYQTEGLKPKFTLKCIKKRYCDK